jgi:hypothetical protein
LEKSMKDIARPFVFTARSLLIISFLCPPASWLAARSASLSDPKATSAESPLQQQVIAAEREGLDALKLGNVDDFASHTADGAIFVDAHGPANKEQVVKNVADFHLTDYSMDDIHFVQLSPHSGLIVYTITEKGMSHGKEFSARAHISSIWANDGGKWVCLFSQETGAR